MFALPILASLSLMATPHAAPAARLALPAILSDGAVIQIGRPVPVWGWATAGANVTVRLAGQERKGVAGKDGRWKVSFKAIAPGPIGDLTVTEGAAKVVAHDLLAGEVWVCSGQSNMGFGLNGVLDATNEVRAANFPQIRLFAQEGLVSDMPLPDTAAKWKTCTPEAAGGFTAVGYFFGRELHQQLKIPVGLINASWGGTNIESWMDAPTLRASKGGRDWLAAWEARARKDPSMVRDRWTLEIRDIAFLPRDGSAAVPLSAVEPSSAAPMTARWTDVWQGSGATIGFSATQPGGATLEVAMVPGGWAHAIRVVAPQGAAVDASRFSAVRVTVRGKGRYLLRLGMKDVWPWEAHRSAIFTPKGDWTEVVVPFNSVKPIDWAPQKPYDPGVLTNVCFLAESALGPNDVAAGLFNGEIHPLMPHAIRGAIWYQGENNAGMADRYRELFPAMIRGWRKGWGQGDFPFLFVQLANYMGASEDAKDSAWAELRDAQRGTLALRNTGMAVAIDLGDALDIHPKDKKTVGVRLALNALATVYGRKIEYSGPTFTSLKPQAGALRLTFTHTTGGLQARGGGPLRGFSIAGMDKLFHRAGAVVDGDSLLVRSADVKAPVAVRYAWSDNPVCNLINGENLPASPFRTDTWPGVTAGR